MNRTKLVIIAGPTASGKTDISLKLAADINGEIISADSMQVYKGMDIGTAKIRPEETQGIKHHMLDVAGPSDEFNAALYKEMAVNCIKDIASRGRIPIVTGGTGFYIDALFKDTRFTEHGDDPEYAAYLEDVLASLGSHGLHELLKETDPVSYEKIHENNIKRTMRALMYNHLTGRPLSDHNEEEKGRSSPYDAVYFVLTKDRERLYRDIELRVDMMFEEGLTDEVRSLRDSGCTKEMVSMQAIGYKEIFEYLEGGMTLSEAKELIKKNTRHYAKRQLTWFRAVKDAVWIYKDRFSSDETILDFMKEELAARGII